MDMVHSLRKSFTLVFALISFNVFPQLIDQEIEAKFDIKDYHEFLEVSATVENKTSITQSLRYVFSFIKPSDQDSLRVKRDIEDYFTINPGEKNTLNKVTVNADEKDRIILLLLIYDLNNEIKAKDRVVLNELNSESGVDGQEITISREPTEVYEILPDVSSRSEEGVVLRGIVINETKTRPGQEFYSMFYSNYSLKEINADRIVVIKESFAIGSTTQIQVLVEDTIIYEFLVRPNHDFLKSMSDGAIMRVSAYLNALKERNHTRRY